MHPKLKELIDNEKEENREVELQKRNEHLISLGLIDEKKSQRTYYDYSDDGLEYDSVIGKFYSSDDVAIEVTDEEYKELCKYFPEKEKEVENKYTELKLREDVSLIKSWVMFWSILTIISFIVLIIFVIQFVDKINHIIY